MSQAWGEVCWAVWLGAGEQRAGLQRALCLAGAISPELGCWASLEAARPWVTRQETNTLSSAPIGNSASVTGPLLICSQH